MHELYSSGVRPELRTYVRAFAQRKLDRASPEIIEPIPAGLESTLDFEFGVSPMVAFGDGRRIQAHSVNLVGPSAYRPVDLHLRGGVETFAIFFQPLAFSQLFRIPMGTLVNLEYNARDILGCDIQELWHKMAETSSFRQRVAIAEGYLLRKAANSLRNTPVVNAALHMLASRGIARISNVANQSSLGLRQFERRFVSEIGLSPKLYSKVARFQAVLDAKVSRRQNAGWLDLAYEFGYFDQTHMIKDFQNLSGLSPECLMLRIGDIRPPALAAGYEDRRSNRVFV
jgi:AraC-like DNA-binding protein